MNHFEQTRLFYRSVPYIIHTQETGVCDEVNDPCVQCNIQANLRQVPACPPCHMLMTYSSDIQQSQLQLLRSSYRMTNAVHQFDFGHVILHKSKAYGLFKVIITFFKIFYTT